MIKYMLDTNICIAIMKNASPTVSDRLTNLPINQVGVSSIVIAELWFGIEHSKRAKENEEVLNHFTRFVTVSAWPLGAAPFYGSIRAHLKSRGTPIGAMDLLIAAHALFLNAVLVTNNEREFKRVPKLKVENWINA